MPLRDSYLMGIFILCNAMAALIFYLAVLRPMAASVDTARTVVSLQEQRLEIYEWQLAVTADTVGNDVEAADGNSDENRDENAHMAAGVQLTAYSQIAEALADIERMAQEVSVQTTAFSSLPPVALVWDGGNASRVYDVRVAAMYRGTLDVLVDFVQLLDAGAVRIRGIHIDFSQRDEAVLRLDFSLFAFFTSGGIE